MGAFHIYPLGVQFARGALTGRYSPPHLRRVAPNTREACNPLRRNRRALAQRLGITNKRLRTLERRSRLVLKGKTTKPTWRVAIG